MTQKTDHIIHSPRTRTLHSPYTHVFTPQKSSPDSFNPKCHPNHLPQTQKSPPSLNLQNHYLRPSKSRYQPPSITLKPESQPHPFSHHLVPPQSLLTLTSPKLPQQSMKKVMGNLCH